MSEPISAAAIVLAIHTIMPMVPPSTTAEFASHIAFVARTRDEALAMVVTARAESSFDPRVANCTITGKAGELTAWQLHGATLQGFTAEAVCSNPILAARLGRDKLAMYRMITGSWRTAIMRYLGHVDERDPRVVRRLNNFDMLRISMAHIP